MATFQVNNKKKRQNKNVKMILGWSTLILSTLVFLFSVTSLVPALQDFFLGILGIFVYPLCVLGLLISLALLNNKKYVMPKSYAILLSLSLILFLSIIQLIVIGGAGELSYGQYIALNYTKKFTAGGMIIGFIPSSLVYLMGAPATYVVLAVALIASVALFVEKVLSIRKTLNQQKPIKVSFKEKEQVKGPFDEKESAVNIQDEQNNSTQKKRRLFDDSVNVTLSANREIEEKRELSAREKLGLAGNYQAGKKELILPKEENNEDKIPKGMSIKEYLLSPPKVDMDKFIEQSNRQRRRVQTSESTISSSQPPFFSHNQNITQTNIFENNLSTNEINRNINSLKEEDAKPTTYSYEESYDFSQDDIKRSNLNSIKPEEITNEAEDIIRSVVEKEKLEREEELALLKEEDSQIDANDFNNSYNQNESDSEYIDYGNMTTESTSHAREDRLGDLQRQSFREREDSLARRDGNVLQNTIRREESEVSQPLRREENILSRDVSRDQNVDANSRFNQDRQLNIDSQSQETHEISRFGDTQSQENHENRFRPNDEIAKRKKFVQLEDDKPAKKIVPYKYNRPPIDLITTQSDDPSRFNDEIPLKRVALENALENFGVPAKVQNVVIGPTVTRYEIEMPEGISVKRILSLDADIAYALSANGQIRIEAPIPGRSIVGIEVPNNKVAKVSIKDVLQAKEFTMSPSPLTFALGKDISGNVRVCNLQKMPHLLVAGTTGSGKSVCLNTIITSILYKASPDEVKFILIDPKQVELSMYEGLPHLIVPRVITDPTKAVNALAWAVDEMERRFRLISEERVRNIGEYNKIDKVLEYKVAKMPYIVIIFDEFADFMAISKNEIEDKIRRLAGKARAAGIHLILATQRPSTDVVTGTLKANLPARIAFKVASRVDSEVILGSTGAEKLLGYGDMLYKPADSDAQRLQGCFIDTPETKDIVSYITANNEEIFDEEAFNAINNPNKSSNGGGNENNGVDPLLPQALKICIDNGVASTTMVQRKLSIGYPRAARIVDQMEERGYISSAEGSKQRSVYITIDEFYSIFGDIYD